MTYQIAEIPLPLDAKDSALWERAAKRLHLPILLIGQGKLVRHRQPVGPDPAAV